MSHTPRVVIIGAGIVGANLADELTVAVERQRRARGERHRGRHRRRGEPYTVEASRRAPDPALLRAAPEASADLRETYGTGTRANEMDILRPVMEAELLVLDDLGQEKTSDWVQETLVPAWKVQAVTCSAR